ncbi:hypothetical protein AAVH_41832 [Aphelenchoides avenae]|nr:hypothetical protein AAVH_41832 [Aphelenchus avenae]
MPYTWAPSFVSSNSTVNSSSPQTAFKPPVTVAAVPVIDQQGHLLLVHQLVEKERRAGEKIYNEFIANFHALQQPTTRFQQSQRQGNLFFAPGDCP